MMITTTKGDMPEEVLSKKTTTTDEQDGIVTATEYWLDGELVHRSLDILLKTKAIGSPQAQGF